jgi:hypothetical protein
MSGQDELFRGGRLEYADFPQFLIARAPRDYRLTVAGFSRPPGEEQVSEVITHYAMEMYEANALGEWIERILCGPSPAGGDDIVALFSLLGGGLIGLTNLDLDDGWYFYAGRISGLFEGHWDVVTAADHDLLLHLADYLKTLGEGCA